MKWDDFLAPCTGMGSKWIGDLGVRPETIKFLDENTINNFSDWQ